LRHKRSQNGSESTMLAARAFGDPNVFSIPMNRVTPIVD
jgi:hypothetical protein